MYNQKSEGGIRNMAYCKNCGSRLKFMATVCEDCGKPVGYKPQTDDDDDGYSVAEPVVIEREQTEYRTTPSQQPRPESRSYTSQQTPAGRSYTSGSRTSTGSSSSQTGTSTGSEAAFVFLSFFLPVIGIFIGVIMYSKQNAKLAKKCFIASVAGLVIAFSFRAVSMLMAKTFYDKKQKAIESKQTEISFDFDENESRIEEMYSSVSEALASVSGNVSEAESRMNDAFSRPIEAVLPEGSDGTSLLDADWEEMTFALDGQLYSFPCELTDLTSNGWEVNPAVINEQIPAQQTYEHFVMIENNATGEVCGLMMYNGGDQECSLDEALVVGIGTWDDLGDSSLMLPGGLTINDDKGAFVDAYGDITCEMPNTDPNSNWNDYWFQNYTGDRNLNIRTVGDDVIYIQYCFYFDQSY